MFDMAWTWMGFQLHACRVEWHRGTVGLRVGLFLLLLVQFLHLPSRPGLAADAYPNRAT